MIKKKRKEMKWNENKEKERKKERKEERKKGRKKEDQDWPRKNITKG